MLNESNIDGYFRAGVGACLVNHKGEILIFRRTDVEDSWQMPQGGIQRGENPEQALIREVSEEAGLGIDDYRIISSTGWISYELPVENWGPKTGRGQTQKWFQCLVNEGVKIVPDQSEFDRYQWVDTHLAIDMAVEFRKATYASVIDAFFPD